MTALRLKLLRDLWRTRAQVASVAAVLAGGVMTVVALRGTSTALDRARTAYYAAGRFGDVFATLTRAPDAVGLRLAAVPGVAQVTTRVVKDVRLDIAGLDRPGIGRLIALPAARMAANRSLNLVRVLRGRSVAPDADDEVLVSGRFAEANHLGPGDSLIAIINQRRARLQIVGIGGAPDYLYEEGSGGMMVDERGSAIIWATPQLVDNATGMHGSFNDVSIELAPGARRESVLANVDSILAPFGGRGAIGRADQLSHRIVENEMRQLAVMGFAFPAFFVAVAAFLAGTILSRLIATERDQIAVLKAFGYTSRAVALHYLAYASASILLGIVVGGAVGAWVGRMYTALYADVLRIPGLQFHADWGSVASAIGILAFATLAGAVRPVRAVALMPPATALQPPPPARYRSLLLDRLGFGRSLPVAARMILRGIERRPSRAMLGAAGVAAAIAMMAGALSLYDASRRMIEVQFRIGHRETLAVQLISAAPISMREVFGRLPGVTAVQLTRVVPVRLHHAGRSRTLALTGLESGGALERLVDIDGATRAVPPGGVVLSASLARALDLHEGDTATVDLLETLATRHIVVGAVIDEIMSPNAYMELSAVNRLVGDGRLATAASLRLDAPPSPAFFAAVRAMPEVAGITSRGEMLANFDRMMARGFRITTTLVVVFASIIAIGVVYNGARIALSERGRELASLRVLGFTTREVGTLLLGEQALLAAAAVPLGWLCGWVFAQYLARGFRSEQYQIPMVVRAGTYAFASAVVLMASAMAGGVMYRRAARLDLVAVLKTKE
jgi:putative ABC transport system permease protein